MFAREPCSIHKILLLGADLSTLSTNVAIVENQSVAFRTADPREKNCHSVGQVVRSL